MDRRGFLGSVLALAAAPAIVRASSLMKLAPGMAETESGIVVPVAELRAGNQLLTIQMITDEALGVLGSYRITKVTGEWGHFRVGDRLTIG
jgi:hypothetical protein